LVGVVSVKVENRGGQESTLEDRELRIERGASLASADQAVALGVLAALDQWHSLQPASHQERELRARDPLVCVPDLLK
jgi:hypothetical protein